MRVNKICDLLLRRLVTTLTERNAAAQDAAAYGFN